MVVAGFGGAFGVHPFRHSEPVPLNFDEFFAVTGSKNAKYFTSVASKDLAVHAQVNDHISRLDCVGFGGCLDSSPANGVVSFLTGRASS